LSNRSANAKELDEWLLRHARTAAGQGTRTYVLVDADESVVGYFAITRISYGGTTPLADRQGAHREILAILLGKLALDRSQQGSGLGSELLVSAIATIVEAPCRAGGRLIVVDAINDHARSFYEHHDVQPLPGNDGRLVMTLSTAAKAIGVDWP
jgi:GNAT superfamily N-acetyltransferase